LSLGTIELRAGAVTEAVTVNATRSTPISGLSPTRGRRAGCKWACGSISSGLLLAGFKFPGAVPIAGDMSVSSITGSDSGGVTAKAAVDHATLAMKKIQDVRQNEAQALVQLISQASEAASGGRSGVGSIISYYA
jgi:hypothetical protein